VIEVMPEGCRNEILEKVMSSKPPWMHRVGMEPEVGEKTGRWGELMAKCSEVVETHVVMEGVMGARQHVWSKSGAEERL
jgi:hypothetical protein